MSIKTTTHKRLLTVFIAISISLAIVLTASARPTRHFWYNGSVTEIAEDSMKVGDKSYELDTNLRIVKHIMKKGAIYEQPATMDDILPGSRVSVKIEYNKIKEIILETYH